MTLSEHTEQEHYTLIVPTYWHYQINYTIQNTYGNDEVHQYETTNVKPQDVEHQTSKAYMCQMIYTGGDKVVLITFKLTMKSSWPLNLDYISLPPYRVGSHYSLYNSNEPTPEF